MNCGGCEPILVRGQVSRLAGVLYLVSNRQCKNITVFFIVLYQSIGDYLNLDKYVRYEAIINE